MASPPPRHVSGYGPFSSGAIRLWRVQISLGFKCFRFNCFNYDFDACIRRCLWCGLKKRQRRFAGTTLLHRYDPESRYRGDLLAELDIMTEPAFGRTAGVLTGQSKLSRDWEHIASRTSPRTSSKPGAMDYGTRGCRRHGWRNTGTCCAACWLRRRGVGSSRPTRAPA